jgi:hypothetical protein
MGPQRIQEKQNRDRESDGLVDGSSQCRTLPGSSEQRLAPLAWSNSLEESSLVSVSQEDDSALENRLPSEWQTAVEF